jgi:hypothetical protein
MDARTVGLAGVARTIRTRERPVVAPTATQRNGSQLSRTGSTALKPLSKFALASFLQNWHRALRDAQPWLFSFSQLRGFGSFLQKGCGPVLIRARRIVNYNNLQRSGVCCIALLAT